MTEPDRVTYEVLVSTGDYSHIKIGVATNVREGEDLTEALKRGRTVVRKAVRDDYKKMGDLRGYVREDDEDAGGSGG
jgi:hypothetical protein